MLDRQEAHQVGDVGGVQVFQQAAQTQAIAVVSGIDDLFDKGRRQHIVLVEGHVLFGFKRACVQGVGIAHASSSP